MVEGVEFRVERWGGGNEGLHSWFFAFGMHCRCSSWKDWQKSVKMLPL